MTRLAWLLPWLLACSSSPFAPGGDAAVTDAAVDAPKSIDAATGDATTASDASDGSDGGLDPFVPHPPDGATKCGSGVISAGSAQSACTKPSMMLDDMLLPDGGFGAMPRACDALTVGAGEWQTWCTPSEVYVWGRIPVVNAGTLSDCHGVSLLMIDEGLYDTGNMGGNTSQVRTYQQDGTEIIGTPKGEPQTIVTWLTVAATSSGGAQMFVAGSLEDTCNGGEQEPPTVLTGFNAQWNE